MPVRQAAKKNATKDGRRWSFYIYLTYTDGSKRKYQSQKYMTKKEVEDAEKKMIADIQKKECNLTDMTFGELFDEFYNYKKDKVKATTLRGYTNIRPKLKRFENMKIRDFDIQEFLKWRKWISSMDLALKTKNGYYKYFKAVLNYGTKWHDFNFTKVYNRMEKFVDPNNLPKEMDYYTYEEFKQFISVIDDHEWKCLFETLYFCGLRRGELRGLTWDNIDLEGKNLTVNKNCVNEKGDHGYWKLCTPKTRTSYRTIPMPDVLVNDLKKYKEECKKIKGFNEKKFFVYGGPNPVHTDALRKHKAEYAEKAGIRVIRTHDFRHSCASLLINNGANIMIVAKYLGHAKIDETLNTYSHLFQSKLDDAVQTINQVINENNKQ